MTESELSGTKTKSFHRLPMIGQGRRAPARIGAALYRMALPVVFALTTFTDRAQTNWELNSVAEVRALTPEQAQRKIPVHLNGVVTFVSKDIYSCFVEDATTGIFVAIPTLPLDLWPTNLEPGQTVEIVGTTSPGEYAPVVNVEHITVMGRTKLPSPKSVSYDQLATGAEDSQFVEISGVVRSLRKFAMTELYEMEIVTGGGRMLVYAKNLPVTQPDELVDSSVRVRGVCTTMFNHQRQLFAVELMVPRQEDLQVEIPAAQHPFEMPPRSIGSLFQFTPQENYGHRVKLTGTVTLFGPGSKLYLQDEHRGVLAETKSTEPLAPGDIVEVLGFPSQGVYTPMLQDAVYRKIRSSTPPAAVRVTTDDALSGNFDSELVQISARVIDRTWSGNEQFLLLQDSNVIFQANLEGAYGADNFAGVENGGVVSVTGVCRIEPGGGWVPGPVWRAKSFNILMRSPSDVTVLQSPPWWTLRKVLWMSGTLAFVALAAFGWVGVLRRQVAERTQQLEAEIQQRQLAERRREIEQERTRVAHDLHDDLGTGLTEVNMLTSLVKSPATSVAEKERYLDDLSETALRMVTSLDEIVWAVNPRNDTIASLASYLGSYARRLLDLASVSCGLDISEDLPEQPLTPKVRQEIFFSLKEALNNVVRHAHATQVWLRIFVREDSLIVELADDGRGLDARPGAPGSDGIANMNERMQSIGGTCEIMSDVQQGTTVRFRAPLSRNEL
jgi:signal transduction histidine kinase